MTCRILVALDGTETAEAVLGDVERVATGGASVHFLYVVPQLPMNVNVTSAGVLAGHDRTLSYLSGLREKFPDIRGLDVIRAGDVAEVILQVGREFDIDVIAFGTDVRSGLAKDLLGSVAEKVVRQAVCPVLLTRPGRDPIHRTLRRILVPLDGSAESLAILPAVKTLALRTRAEVVFLQLSEQALAPSPRSDGSAAVRIHADPKERLLSLTHTLARSDLVYWQTVGSGDAVEEILEHGKTLEADLIAMSTQAGGDLDTTLVGGVAMAIVGRTDRAVLLQRPILRPVVPRLWRYQ